MCSWPLTGVGSSACLPPGSRSIANLLAIQPCSDQVRSRCATTYKGMDGWTDRRMDGQWLYCQPSLRTFCFSLGSHTALWQSQLPNKTVCISGSPVGLISCSLVRCSVLPKTPTFQHCYAPCLVCSENSGRIQINPPHAQTAGIL